MYRLILSRIGQKNAEKLLPKNRVTLFGLIIVPKREVPYGKISPEESHNIFIRSALVNGEIMGKFSFLKHNRKIVEELAEQEDMLRRRDVLVSEEKMVSFYSERLPGVCRVADLNKMIRKKGSDAFLKMKEEDLILCRPSEEELSLFPGHTVVKGRKFKYSYRFSPGRQDDGITISIPASLSTLFPAERLEWMVPGLYQEKVTALIKGLPKRFRKRLVPVPEKVKIVLAEMKISEGPLITALSNFIYQRFGVDIPSSEWPVNEIPDHLKMRISVVDHNGRELESGRDKDILKKDRMIARGRENYLNDWKAARKQWERKGITSWDFEDLPLSINVNRNLVAYPALEPADGCVNVKIFDDINNAVKSHKMGVKELFSLHLKKEIRFMKRVTGLPPELGEQFVYFGDIRQYEKELISGFLDKLFPHDIRTRDTFLSEVERIKAVIVTRASEFMERISEVLNEYCRLRRKLYSLESANKGNGVILDFISGIRRDLENLVPRAFYKIYTEKNIRQLPRYIKAISIRAERGTNDVNKDRGKSEQAEVFIRMLDEMKKELSVHSSAEKLEALDEFRWAIEEYKVSLFAQELKTAFPVSNKRMLKRANEIKRMI